MNTLVKSVLLLIGALWLTACSDKITVEEPVIETTSWDTVRVAVIVPLSGEDSYDRRFKRIAQYFEENAVMAQRHWTDGIHLELEWYDENAENIADLTDRLIDREDLKAIIGPTNDKNNKSMYNKFLYNYTENNHIPILTFTATDDLVRKYSLGSHNLQMKEPFLWSLREPDATQAQLMMYKVATSGGRKVSLLARAAEFDDEFGQDVGYGAGFRQWIPYHAVENNLEMVDNIQYNDPAELKSGIEKLLSSDTEYIVCAVDKKEDLKTVLEAKQQKPDSPKLLFTGSVFQYNVLSLGSLAEGMEGFSLYSSPNTGFQLAYEQRFGEAPKPYDSQFYDALLLSFVAANLCKYGDEEINMKQALMTLSDLPLTEEEDQPEDYDWGKGTPVWDHHYLGLSVLSPIRTGRLPELNLLGASGNLKFAADSYTCLVQSTFINWMIANGKPVVLDYVAAQGNRVSNYQAAWMHQNTVMDQIPDKDPDIQYPELKDQWAVLISGSMGWSGYRFQADLLRFYHFLKSQGMKDDRIILIMRDDIAMAEQNPYPGIIRSRPDGENLYHDFELDYKTDSLTATDLADILKGKKSSRLPVVLESTANDNVLFFWTSHGYEGCFNWSAGAGGDFDYELLRGIFTQMHAEKRYRKMLFLAEACYSGSMAMATEGFPGMLSMSSSNDKEIGKSDRLSSDLKVAMCNRFTDILLDEVTRNPQITFYDLYLKLNQTTLGSHPRVYNFDRYDNLHFSSPSEFYQP